MCRSLSFACAFIVFSFNSSELSPAVPFFTAVLTLLMLISMISVSTSDPGILPRGIQPEVLSDNGDVPAYVTEICVD
jgi:hypothetical protein